MAERKFTDLELERHIAGDLPEARAKELDEQATAADRARLAELRAEGEAFLRSVDVDLEVRRIQQRVARAAPEAKPKAWWRWLAPAGALAAAAAVILVIVKRGDDDARKPDGDDLIVKGDDVTLVVHVATDAGSRRLTSGDTVQPGDRLRFEVNALKPGFVAILGIDGTGTTGVYFSGEAGQPLSYDPQTRLLPGAIELDATPGDERFFVIYSRTPFAVDAIKPLLRDNAALPPGLSKHEVTLHKGAK